MHIRTSAAGALLAGLALAGAADAAPPNLSVDLHHRTLVVTRTADAEAIALRPAGRKLEIDAGRDGSAEFRIERHRFDRVVVLGGDGSDELVVSGGDARDRFSFSAGRDGDIRFVDGDRDPLRLDGIERLAVTPGGGADTVVAGDVTGSVVNDVDLDLAAADGAADRVVVEGTDGPDFPSVFGGVPDVFVGGLASLVQMRNAAPADALVVRGRAGDDVISAGGVPAGAPGITLEGGPGDDGIDGGDGDDLVIGGGGTDIVDPNRGDDVALLGSGLDGLRWDPGDGSDVVDGQAGPDSLLFIGSADDETFTATADGRGVRFTRDVGGIVMDLRDVEHLETLADRGADRLSVGDLSGTVAELVEINLGGALGSPASDGAADVVEVLGTAGDDALRLTGAGTTAELAGLPATVRMHRADGATDRLAVQGGAGADALDSTALPAGLIGVDFAD